MAEEQGKLVVFQKDTAELLQESLDSLIEGLTGLAVSDKKDLALSVGHILQSVRRGHFLSQLMKEWCEYREKGKIKDDYCTSEQHYTCLQELLDFLDKDSPDEIRFDALKKIFLVAASEKIVARDNLLPQQYMKVCRSLTSGEVVLLSATYRVSERKAGEVKSADAWLEVIVGASGLAHRELVEIHEEGLIEKRLLTSRVYGDRSGVRCGSHFRLTDLGYHLCKFIETYETL